MSDSLTFTAGGVQRVRPGCRDALFGPDGLRIDEWLRTGAATVVKHGPHRTVYRVRLPGLDCHVKHYRLMDARAWLRELVRLPKAVAEYRRAGTVADRGVPTAEPLAVGRQLRPFAAPGESFLITRTLEDAVALGPFLETTLPTLPVGQQARIRQNVAAAVGELLARMHAGGVVHHDLHPGNILVRLDPAERVSLFLIDLHMVAVGGPLRWPARQASLVMLNRYFVLRASRSDRLRFWEAYRGHVFDAADPAAVRRLERDTLRSNLWFWKQRDRRCLVNNRYYVRVRGRGVMGHAVRDLDRTVLDRVLQDPDAPFAAPGVVLLKDSRSSTVAELTLATADGPRQVIYKRFRVTAWADPFAALVRRTPALRSWVHGHGLRERCLPTPRPLAVFHRVRRGLLREGYLLTEKLLAAVDLREFVLGLRSLPVAERRPLLRQRLEEVARLVRSLHDRRLTHRDLKAANILLSGDRVWLIDLVGVTRHRRTPRRQRVQNLTRLNASFLHDPVVTRTEKLRFLRLYLRTGLVGAADWKGWWQAVEEATRAKVERNRRNGRLLA